MARVRVGSGWFEFESIEQVRPGVVAAEVFHLPDGPEPVPDPDPDPDPGPDPDPSRPVALTLDEWNTGAPDLMFAPVSDAERYIPRNGDHLSDAMFLDLHVDPDVDFTYENIRVVSGGHPYTVWNRGGMEGEGLLVNGGDGKACLQQGRHFVAHRPRFTGGEDAFHHNGSGPTELYEAILEDVKYPTGSHSNPYQASSGGRGGSLLMVDSVAVSGFRMQDAALQFNIGTDAVIRGCALSGGPYTVYGDEEYAGSIDLFDCLYAWGTSQFGPISGKAVDHGGVWWDPREVRPRRVNPWIFLEGPAMEGFPGSGVPIAA